MKVYINGKWQTRIRVFAATYDDSANLIQNPRGSHAGINTPNNKSGFILFNDAMEPLRDKNGKFITSESHLFTHNSFITPTTPLVLETAFHFVRATEFIPKFSLVTMIGPNEIALASNLRVDRMVTGLVEEDLYMTETARLITAGSISNEQWNFSDTQIGKALFCGATGEVTANPPQEGLSQVIGKVLSRNTIHFMPMLPIDLSAT
jgi:hypothetical protein